MKSASGGPLRCTPRAMNRVHKFRSEYRGLAVDETAVIYRDPEDQC